MACAGDTPQQRQLLAALLRCMALVGALAAVFGPAYAFTVLRVAYGQRWSSTEAAAALAAYSLYIPLLAVNGILEVSPAFWRLVHGMLCARLRVDPWRRCFMCRPLCML